MTEDKQADLIGPGIGNYDDLKKELPDDYDALLPPMERMKAVFSVKGSVGYCYRKDYKAGLAKVLLVL